MSASSPISSPVRPGFIPPSPPSVCRGCGLESGAVSPARVCAGCQSRCGHCGNHTGMLNSRICFDCIRARRQIGPARFAGRN